MKKLTLCVVLIAGCGVGGGSSPRDAALPRDTAVPPADTAVPPVDSAADTSQPADAFVPSTATWEATLTGSDAEAGDHLGTSVAISADGTRALVGSYTDTSAVAAMSGTARVFVRDGTSWTEEATLFAADGAANDRLGYAVAISGDGTIALVGAPNDDGGPGADTGSVRVFVRAGTFWSEETTLLAPDATAGDGFGNAVAISTDGTRAIVGVALDDTAGGTDSGSAHVFVRSPAGTWSRETTVRPIEGAANDAFGISVAISGDGTYVLVGADHAIVTSRPAAGSAWIFVRAGTAWSQQASLRALDPTANERLGSSVALSSDGTRALVGAAHDDTTDVGTGGARVFLRTDTTWATEATLVASDAAAGDRFGSSVALSVDGAFALIGAPDDATATGTTGSARVFARTDTSWAETTTLIAPDSASGDAVGVSVALTGDASRALVGAFTDATTAGAAAGSAHVFVLSH